jgi:hypothetical protein
MKNSIESVRTQGLRAAVVVVSVFAGLFAAAGTAGATTVDPTGGGAATLTSDITGWITTYGVPLIVGVMAVGLVVMLFIKYGKRAVKAGS